MDIWGYYNPFMRPIQVDFVNIRAAGRFADSSPDGGAFGTMSLRQEKRFFASLRMTMGVGLRMTKELSF